MRKLSLLFLLVLILVSCDEIEKVNNKVDALVKLNKKGAL